MATIAVLSINKALDMMDIKVNSVTRRLNISAAKVLKRK
jgi:hypothetical protein